MEFDGLDLGSLAEFGDIGGFPDLSGLDVGGLDLGALADMGDIGGFADLGGLDIGGLDLGALAEFGDIGGFADLGGNEDIASAFYESLLASGDLPEMRGDYGFGGYDLGGQADLDAAILANRENAFNAARDSQLANEMIERGEIPHLGSGREAALAGYRASGATPSRVTIGGQTYSTSGPPTTNRVVPHSGTNRIPSDLENFLKKMFGGGGGGDKKDQNLLGSLLPLLLLMMAMRDKDGGAPASNAVIPALTATQKQTPYTQIQQAPGYRPGQGGITYFNPVQYTPRMASGGIVTLAEGGGLSKDSTAQEIADAYKSYIDTAGGDRPETQAAAVNFLRDLGIGDETIMSGYREFLADTPAATATTAVAERYPYAVETMAGPQGAEWPVYKQSDVNAAYQQIKTGGASDQDILNAAVRLGVPFEQLAEAERANTLRNVLQGKDTLSAQQNAVYDYYANKYGLDVNRLKKTTDELGSSLYYDPFTEMGKWAKSKPIFDALQNDLRSLGRTAAPPENAVYSSRAVYNPQTKGIDIVDKNGVLLHGGGEGRGAPFSEAQYAMLDRLRVDPASFREAQNKTLANLDYRLPESTIREYKSIAADYRPRYASAPDTQYMRAGLDPTVSAGALFSWAGLPSVKDFMDKTGLDFDTAVDMLPSRQGISAMLNWDKIMASPNPVAALNAGMAAIAADPNYSRYASQVYGENYRGWNFGGNSPVASGATANQGIGSLPITSAASATRAPTNVATDSGVVAPRGTYGQTDYVQQMAQPGYRPGQGGLQYFTPYTMNLAGGGVIDLARALAAKRREQRLGLLKGRGDGVSDSIPAMIGKDQPARLARGEYVVDARTVAELGNGSTDAGAERLDEMRKRVHAKRKKAKVGEDSGAHKALPA